ncbi:MAG: nucleoside hydrolase [Chloroflexota bacterium]
MTLPTFPQLTEDQLRQRLEPPTGKARLIIDTDAHNEIDDQFSIAWALLSPEKFDIEGVLAVPYSFAHHREPMLKAYELLKAADSGEALDHQNHGESVGYTGWAQRLIDVGTDPYAIPFVSPEEGMELSYQEILTVYGKLGVDATGQVFRGSPNYLKSLDEPIRSPAVDHLIERALTGGDEPLYVAGIGCATNLASAILIEPEIIKHIVILWTSAYPTTTNLWNGASLNLVQDPLASQLLFDCGVPHVYLPGFHVGAQLKISLPEMELWVKGQGAIGDYLHHLYTHNPIYHQRGINDYFGRSWIVWDLVNFAWLLNPDWVPSHLTPAPILNDALYWETDPSRHLIREAYDIDRDAIFRDLFTKLAQAAS